MEDYFIGVGLIRHIRIDTFDPDDRSEALARNKLTNNLSPALQSVIQRPRSAFLKWQALRKHCLGEATYARIQLQAEFSRLILNVDKPV